jgi:predicted RNA binding protein YcfA (HicA-like mRNA interferase family)
LKLPRDVSSDQLIRRLSKYGYSVSRQVGSHIRLTSNYKSFAHYITIPNHDPLKIGTLSGILSEIAIYLEIDRRDLIERLFNHE